MPVEFKFVDEKKGVLISAEGYTLGEDLISTMKQIFSNDDEICNYRYGICDFSGIDKFDISHDQIFAMSKLHVYASKLNPDIIVGFAINKPVIYGLVGIWMVYATLTGWKVHVESDLQAIQSWVTKHM